VLARARRYATDAPEDCQPDTAPTRLLLDECSRRRDPGERSVPSEQLEGLEQRR